MGFYINLNSRVKLVFHHQTSSKEGGQNDLKFLWLGRMEKDATDDLLPKVGVGFSAYVKRRR